MRSSLTFGSLLVYSPRGTSEESTRSRRVVEKIKNDGAGPIPPERMIDFAVRRLVEVLPETPLSRFFPEGATLVPVPRSAPPKDASSLWVPRRIAKRLVASGIGSAVVPWLRRTSAVQKSAWSAPGHRPALEEHISSLEVRGASPMELPADLVVVDDVVTKGATLLAAAAVLQEAFPASRVRGFALVRTMGLVLEVDRILDPCLGTISVLPDGSVDRDP